jgi:hypothetical protein
MIGPALLMELTGLAAAAGIAAGVLVLMIWVLFR